MRTRRIHLINPKTKSFTTRPMYMNRALYSPLAGLLAVAALIPQDQYEVILTDENIEPIDFDLKADLVGISAMTSYVKRGYEIADTFRNRGIPVVMGGVHPSFMPTEALEHADAVIIGEAELVMPRVLEDLKQGNLKGTYQANELHSMVNMPLPRYDLLKANRYVNKTFIQTSRGCHHACTFCSEPLMNGLRFRYRPIDEVIREIEACGERVVALNDADFFGTPKRPAELMRALKGRGIRWQAGVTSRLALNDELLELAAESGCFMLSIGFESISRETLKSVHKYVNQPDTFGALVEKVHSYGILVFGLFIFGFDQDDPSVFEETVKFNIGADYDMCAYSVMTPYPGTLTWFEMIRDKRVVSYDWDKYDQGHIVCRPINLTPDQLREGHMYAYKQFYSIPSILRRFPATASRSKLYWTIFNLFFRKGEVTGRDLEDAIAEPTAVPRHLPQPPIMPERLDWKELVLENNHY
ncbi:MAG TPA: radical SAM protein [Nitrospiria bacterium]|nr:radical SAM protein [Nitrospiria bacterium]